MKKFFLIGFLINFPAFSNDLHDFYEIKRALYEGASIRIIINYDKCLTKNKSPSPNNFLISTTPQTFIFHQNGRIVGSVLRFTLKNHNFPGKPVYEVFEYVITTNNMVQVTPSILALPSYKTLIDYAPYRCEFDIGAKIYSWP